MTEVVDAIQIDEAAFRGHVVRPGEPEYDVHRKIWNGSFDRHPAVIVRCAGVSDVIAAVKLGRASGLPVAVRSGGHSFPGLSVADDALMIDLSPMKGVRVDPEQQTARVQAGVLLGELDRETQAFGLAVPSGIVTHTGRGRAHARRRDRLDHAQARTVGRPARLGGSRDGRRRVRQGERGRERRSLLGRARRRRQLRDRHGVRVPLCAAGHAGAGGPDFLADGEVGRRPALLSRLGRRMRRTS